ncbi:MAG: phosphatase PAP2 family protein [Clostridia bacterium]|nr:phosphatase PAP2 family protein [Clostridia bacterium]
MNKKNNSFKAFGIALLVFVIYTLAVKFINVKPIGPQNSKVGFGALNGWFFDSVGSNMIWFDVTEYIGIASIAIMAGFALFGLYQLIKERSIFGVHPGILALGVTYFVLALFYVLFEKLVINYRPTLIDGVLEASYPSSHTMLIVTVMITAMIQLNKMLENKDVKFGLTLFFFGVAILATFGRLWSGVHWLTDIIGGVILSVCLIILYATMYKRFSKINKSASYRR